MDTATLKEITGRFGIDTAAGDIRPLGDGLINDTYFVEPGYVLQRINHNIFTDVDGLQRNIGLVTGHIRRKLAAKGVTDIDRRVLRFREADNGKTYVEAAGGFWRVSDYIKRSETKSEVNELSARQAGEAFGDFQAMLVDLGGNLIETIPDFHNMELRLRQLREAVAADRAGRLSQVGDLVSEIEAFASDMCLAERLHREGTLPKRICHCDTKVSNMLFDPSGEPLCVIDLDTVMPSFVFSDFGDFLRTAANTAAEDEPDTDKIGFDMKVFKAFATGYLGAAGSFLTPVERDNLPYAVTLFPYMQAVRFLTDYINGDTYYKTSYREHNLVRARAQWRYFQLTLEAKDEMSAFIAGLCRE
ncbi:MAG: aminoglycoside phosphotransferase family protein [Muribaculaceae bacterium]|nr:aminoglycoside phosphotransferase family protein [Muribaculaceae bacterium]MDE7142658.1 aminoglycoside phosphotransferase family protein [Muribaculaceae bacterium]